MLALFFGLLGLVRGGLASLRSARFLLHVALRRRWYHVALLSLLELLAGFGEGLSLRLLLRQPHHHGHLQPLLLLVHLLELLERERAQVHDQRLLHTRLHCGVAARREERLNELRDECFKQYGNSNVYPVVCDVVDEAQAEQLIQKTIN